MKIIIAALMLLSANTFASERSSVDSFLSILPIGQYIGVDDQGANCSVKVSEANFPDKTIIIIGKNEKYSIPKMVKEGSDFIIREHRKEFIQTHRFYVDGTKNSFVERIVRTLIAGENQLYVVTAIETNIMGKFTSEKVECVINLK